MEHLTSGNAAFVLLVNNLLSKTYMTVSWRLKMMGKSMNEIDDLKCCEEFKKDHCKQLNESEWSTILFPAFCYLSLKGVKSPIASALGMIAAPWFMWGPKLIPGTGILGSVGRYFCLGFLCYEFYKHK